MKKSKNLEINVGDNEKITVKPEDTKGDFILISPLSRFLGGQDQYLSHYFYNVDNRPILTNGLRIKNDSPCDYHQWKIHKDDVNEFIRRYRSLPSRQQHC